MRLVFIGLTLALSLCTVHAAESLSSSLSKLLRSEDSAENLARLKAFAEDFPEQIRSANHEGNALHILLQRNLATPELLSYVIELGVSLSETDRQGRSALLVACHERNAEMVKILLDAGANPDILGGQNPPALTTCIHQNWQPGITLLLQAGAKALLPHVVREDHQPLTIVAEGERSMTEKDQV